MKLLQSKLDSLLGTMPTDSPMPSPDINAPSPSTSSVSIEDLNISNVVNYENISSTDKYTVNTSIENCNNDTDIYVPTTVTTNIKSSYVMPESFSTVQGMSDLSFYFIILI